MINPISTAKKQERAVLVGVLLPFQKEQEITDYLDELEFLTETAGAITLKRFIQKIDEPNPRTFIGSGKVQEIAAYIDDNDVDMVIFDDELSPTQLRNLEHEFKRKVLDRTNLILDVFAQRAKTAYAKTQVELAQYQFLLPRLKRMWTHLERQRGGIGLRGPGEREIETDRRIIRDRIAKLKEELNKIDRQMATQRKNRGSVVRVALVGYTNVGKSTIMNLISKSDVFAENKLFATLDTTVRKVVIGNLPFLLSDTVGFIRKLPHQLVESFKSTLDEVREADLLLHVVDIAHPNFEEQINIVNQTLHEIGGGDKPTILVFNKIDAYTWTRKPDDDLAPSTRENISLDELKRTWISKKGTHTIFISAKQKINIDEFRALLYTMVREIHVTRYPYDNFLYPDITEANL
ncbi:MAG: GTPase HflX [Tenuifilum sp.]|uniref:GTPase HflX n=1 Tax=Tenuifilum sp. TaxID=2760880 RepID=UPI0030B05A85